MLLTFQGFFEEGQFIPSEPVKETQGRKKAILTILEEKPTKQADDLATQVCEKAESPVAPIDIEALLAKSDDEFYTELFKNKNPIITPPKYTGPRPIPDEYFSKPFIHTKGWKFNRDEANER